MFYQIISTRGKHFLKELDRTISKFAMLKHPFYQLWSEGRLDRNVLAEYSKQYYAQVKAFPTYVSAVHSNCQDVVIRQMLLENLIEEERGAENHPELWLRFAERLGVKRDEVESATLLPSTIGSVNTLKKITRSENYLKGIAGLYAYESQIPDVAKTKREGLASFYGIEDARSVSFFSVHEVADVYHRQVEREILVKNCGSEEMQKDILHSAEESAKALWKFLDGVYQAYITEEVKSAVC